MTIDNTTWKINISAAKRNVFFSLSDSSNKVKKLLTPGIILRSGVKRDEYQKLDNKKDRRKKRSLRLFINNQKRTPPACAQTWKLMYDYILEKKLKAQKFILILGGSNLKLSKSLGQNIIKKAKLNIVQIIAKTYLSHNGCPQKIQKRKKNKGRNRRLKRSLNIKKKLPKEKGHIESNDTSFRSYFEDNKKKLLKAQIQKIIPFAKIRRRLASNKSLRFRRNKGGLNSRL